MTRIGALIFVVGMVLSLGSITTFIVMNVTVGSSSDVVLIHHQRIFAAASSRALTVPGVCMLLAASMLSSGLSGWQSFHNEWGLARLVLAALTFINTTVVRVVDAACVSARGRGAGVTARAPRQG